MPTIQNAVHIIHDLKFHPRRANGGKVESLSPTIWRLSIPSGPTNSYRLAQLDNYATLPRAQFPCQPSFHFELRLRASGPDLPGTWGFGLWNDPFSLALPGAVGGARLPILPNTAWFFYASPENHLAFRDDLPGSGWLTSVFRATNTPWLWLGLPVSPLLLFPAASRLFRRLARRFVQQETHQMPFERTEWHTYRLEWLIDKVIFKVDDQLFLQTSMTPQGRLGMVIWLDNQVMSWRPDGRLRLGTLANPQEAWLEIQVS
jgi:hypothetical protein